jgi:hypothetical protein
VTKQLKPAIGAVFVLVLGAVELVLPPPPQAPNKGIERIKNRNFRRFMMGGPQCVRGTMTLLPAFPIGRFPGVWFRAGVGCGIFALIMLRRLAA